MAPPSVPTHPHNKAPTADRLVAGGGFFGKRRESLRFCAARHIIYRACPSLSAPLRPSAPRVHALRRCPSARRPPFGARPAPRPCALRPSPCEKPVVFRFSPPLFREKPTFPRNAPAFLSPPRRRARPHGRGTGGKFHIAAEKVRRNAHAFTFFLFLLAFYAGKTRYICIENLFYQLRMAKSRRFVAPFVYPAECSHTFLPSL